LTSTLLKKRGNCLGLTTALLAVGSRVGAAAMPLLFDGHICACLFEGNERVVIECSRGGALISERLAMRLHGESRGRLLTDEELLGVHLANRAAFVLVPRGKTDAAMRSLDQALEAFPDYVGGRINRATLLIRMGLLDEASAELDRVIRLEPGPGYRRVARDLLGQLIIRLVRSEQTVATAGR